MESWLLSPHAAWSIWLYHPSPVQPTSPWSKGQTCFLGSSLVSTGSNQRADTRNCCCFCYQGRETAGEAGTPWGRMEESRLCPGACTCVCVCACMCEVCMCHFGWVARCLYVGVATENRSEDSENKVAAQDLKGSWKAAPRSIDQNKNRAGSCIRRGRMPESCWRTTSVTK